MIDKIKVFPLFSGSKGNSTLVMCGDKNFLIDVGTTRLKIKTKLNTANLSLSDIDGIFITHCHSDHIKALFDVTKECDCKIYSSKETLQTILRENCEIDKGRLIAIKDTLSFDDLMIHFFSLNHDVTNIGFRFNYENETFSYLTDLGCYTDEVVQEIKGSQKVLVESNHDVWLLKNGNYPYILKRRILSDFGHLSNGDCASLCRTLYLSGTREFILGHLSEENNYPELAFETVNEALSKLGNDYKLFVTNRNGLSEIV